MREFGTAYALIGAVLFDLALARKIDTDTEAVHVIDATPTGQPAIDRVLIEMAGRTDLTVRGWIEELFLRRRDLEGEALGSLIARGVLRHERSNRLWVIDMEKFPVVDNRHQQHVKLRLAHAILTDDIPDTRDIMLVSIAEQCGLLEYILSPSELANRRQRIQVLSNLETISRKVTAAILNLDAGLRSMTRVG